MYIDLKRGRLARSLNKCTSPFRWMGCKIAVYDLVVPSESGMKGGNVRSVSRPKKSRNRRSSRGSLSLLRKKAVRVERALARSTPQALGSSDPHLKRVVPFSRVRRANDYSRRLIHKIKWLTGVRNKMSSLKYKVPDFDTDHYDRIRMYIKEARRDWVALARARSSDPEVLIRMRLELLVDGIDTVHERLVRNKKIAFLESVSTVIPPAPIGESNLGSAFNSVDENGQRPASYRWECTKCQRASGIRVCRLCGMDLENPDRKKRRAVGKPSRTRAPTRRT